MADELRMVQLVLEMPRLLSAARRDGLPLRDLDDGYLVHRALAALFGNAAPKPFRVRTSKSRAVTVLGYTRHARDDLEQQARTFAPPDAYESCHWADLAVKPMPHSWPAGTVLGFEVRVCPVVRLASDVRARAHDGRDAVWRKGAEVDACLHRRFLSAGAEPEAGRETVYLDWLAERLAPAARIDARLEGFRRVRLLRSRHRAERRHRSFERPDALLAGSLEITDGEAFGALLVRGVGRHRAFGFGMLLLRPADR